MGGGKPRFVPTELQNLASVLEHDPPPGCGAGAGAGPPPDDKKITDSACQSGPDLARPWMLIVALTPSPVLSVSCATTAVPPEGAFGSSGFMKNTAPSSPYSPSVLLDQQHRQPTADIMHSLNAGADFSRYFPVAKEARALAVV